MRLDQNQRFIDIKALVRSVLDSIGPVLISRRRGDLLRGKRFDDCVECALPALRRIRTGLDGRCVDSKYTLSSPFKRNLTSFVAPSRDSIFEDDRVHHYGNSYCGY